MKQTIKKAFYLLSFIAIFVMSSCEKDLYEDAINKNNIKKIKIEETKFNDLLHSKRFNFAYQSVEKSKTKLLNSPNGKTAIEDQYNFTIVNSSPIKVITEEDNNQITYIMLIERPLSEDLKFENLIINDKNGILDARIIKYTLSKKGDVEQNHGGVVLNITDEQMTNLEIDGKLGVPCVITETLMCDDTGGGTWEHDHVATSFCLEHSNNLYFIMNIDCGGGTGNESSGSEGSTDGGTSSTGNNGSSGNENSGASGTIPSIPTSPIPCTGCVEVINKTPCEVLNNILQSPTSLPTIPSDAVSIKNALLDLVSKVTNINNNYGDHEEGYNMVYNQNTNQMYAFPADHSGANNMVQYHHNNQVFGGAHYHQDGLQPQFSHADIGVLYQFIQQFNIPAAASNPNYPAPVHIMVSNDGNVYAIMAESAEIFSTLINDIYHDKDRRRDFESKLERKYADYFWPGQNKWVGTQAQYEMTFLKFIKSVNQATGNGYGDLGLKMYRAKPNLTGWQELTLIQPNELQPNNFFIKPINCN